MGVNRVLANKRKLQGPTVKENSCLAVLRSSTISSSFFWHLGVRLLYYPQQTCKFQTCAQEGVAVVKKSKVVLKRLAIRHTPLSFLKVLSWPILSQSSFELIFAILL